MDIENCILPLLGKTVKYLDLYIEDQLAEAGIPLTKLQFVFLIIIENNKEQPQSSLAELTGRDKTTFTRNINTLERKNLVTRKPSPSDKRNKLVNITSLGREYINKSKPIIQKIISEIEEDITDQERENFMRTLNKIRTKLLQKKQYSIT
jgi:DNA-binding MarR family transcriptional regulator